MPAPRPVPAVLLGRPFTSAEAAAAGVTPTMLRGRRFRSLHRGVWVLADHSMSDADWRRAARLAMPADARMSHVSRLQDLGLRRGVTRPVHFTVARDLHLAVPGIFLHRTERLPPADDCGVSPAAALLGYCATARVIDAVVAGDWLLHRDLTSAPEIRELARRDRWRPGAAEAAALTPLLDDGARSPRESETRAVLGFAGLPRPLINVPLADDPTAPIGDLVYARWRLAVEYEGSQHFGDRGQGLRDISRYAWMRRCGIAYVQVTSEMLAQPRSLALVVHARLVERGYGGPAPVFGARWAELFGPCTTWAARRRAVGYGSLRRSA